MTTGILLGNKDMLASQVEIAFSEITPDTKKTRKFTSETISHEEEAGKNEKDVEHHPL